MTRMLPNIDIEIIRYVRVVGMKDAIFSRVKRGITGEGQC